MHQSLEDLARREGINAAAVIAVGAADKDSVLVTGPRRGDELPPRPMERILGESHEVCGTGTLFPNQDGEPILHMHLACGRAGKTITGCVRRGVRVWQVLELVVLELEECTARRLPDPQTGFELLRA